MIRTKSELNNVLQSEFTLYFPNKKAHLRAFLLQERNYRIWVYQKCLRKLEFYKNQEHSIVNKLLYAYYSYKVNKLGNKLGIETWQGVFAQGLHIFHIAGGIIVNSKARVGCNCHLHGNNCICNNGRDSDAPVIGNDCSLGVGAKVIGNIQIGNNIKIAAGAVVVKSCLEDGVTLAGVPANIVKRNDNG